MVTSGVVPGLVFQMMIDHSSTAVVAHMQWFPYFFLITLGSCYRFEF
jgi:hypothetical protein